VDKKTTKMVHMGAFAFLVIGGLNWGIVGLLGGLNIVELILGEGSILSQIVYILVGISAVYIGAMHMKDCKICSEKKD